MIVPLLRTEDEETTNATSTDVERAFAKVHASRSGFLAVEHESEGYIQGYPEVNGSWVVEVPHSGTHKHLARLSEADARRVFLGILVGRAWRSLAEWEEEHEPERFTRLTRKEADAVLPVLDVADAASMHMEIREGLTADFQEAISDLRARFSMKDCTLHDGHLLLVAHLIVGATGTKDPARIRGPLADVLRKCIAAGQGP